MSEHFVGKGIAFPMRVDSTGRIALSSRDDEIVESIRLILGTAPGERPMRPDFGCAIHDHVFAPADAGTAGRIAYEVEVALARWEPRIEVHEVVVVADETSPNRLFIEIVWSVRQSNDPRNLVFPFYVIPDEGLAAPSLPSRRL